MAKVLRLLVEVAWRRRVLLFVPALCMLPLALGWALYGPRTYVAKSLMLLQETSAGNPFSKESSQVNARAMQERFVGLQALLKSERVLGNVYRDLYGEAAARDSKAMATWTLFFAPDVSLELFGADFIEFRLKGGNPKGMGKRLEAVTARFLEALLPEQNVLSATQVLLDRRREELDAAERALAAFKLQWDSKLNANPEQAEQYADARRKLLEAGNALAQIKAEADEVRGRLAAKSTISGRIEQDIAQVRAEISSLEAKGSDAGAELQVVQGRLADLILIRDLEAKRIAVEAEAKELSRVASELQRSTRQAAPYLSQMAQLEREVVEARDGYETYTLRYAKSSAGRAGGVLNAPERIKLIDAPRDPEIAATTGVRFATIALMASIIFGLGLAVLAEVFDTRVRRPEDLADSSGLPLVARLD